MAMLEVKNIGISFGGLKAVDNFSLTIEKGQLYGLIGPNGAGKTTIFNLLTGVYKADHGAIFLDGKELTGKSTIEINQAGIARTFQNIRLFKDLSVLDNVKVGLHNHHPYSTIEGIFRLPRYYKVEKEMNARAMELLKVFDLDKVPNPKYMPKGCKFAPRCKYAFDRCREEEPGFTDLGNGHQSRCWRCMQEGGKD